MCRQMIRRAGTLGATVIAAMGLWAASAPAAIVVERELPDPTTGNVACGPLSQAAHVVTGGCHVAIDSPLTTLIAHTGTGEVVVSNCAITGEARVDSSGSGWIVSQSMQSTASGSCPRAPCDEASHADIPWPLTIEDAGDTTTVEVTFCVRLASGSEGSGGSSCLVHLPISIPASHTYSASSVSLPSGEAACEGLPQTELSGTYTGQNAGTERVEIINT